VAATPESGGDQHLLVSFATGKGRELGVQHVRLGGGIEPYTVFARQSLKAGDMAVFLTVLVPHFSKDSAEALGKGLVFDMMKNRTKIRIALPNFKAELEIGDDGEWSVVR
jgi:hypothetical protein